MAVDMKKILFIGNSYTFFNNMPEEIFAPIARSAGYEVEVSSITKGGERLSNHAKSDSVTGKKIEAALASTAYDAVILQEQSTLPIVDLDTVISAAKALDKKIKKSGAETFLYATYARKLGHPFLAEHSLTPKAMTERMFAAYNTIGEAIGAKVSPVVLAFGYIVENYPEIELYNADKLHPSYVGSALAAMVIFCTVFDETPDNISFDRGIDPNTLSILKNATKEALR